MAKLDEQIRKLEEQDAEESVERHLATFNAEQRDTGLMVLGGIRVAGQIASTISAEAFKALIRFGEEKLFQAFGFSTFADFLNESPFSPMTKTQFYARKTLFEGEGERLFDIFGELGLSIRKRKLLGKGNVEIDGDTATIRDENGEETIVDINDHARLMEVVTAVVDSKLALQHKYDRQAETIEKQKVTIQNAHDDLDTARASKIAVTASNPHMVARVELGLAFRKLSEAAAALSAIEKEQFRDGVLEDVAAWRFDLTAAYATGKVTEPGPVQIKGDDFGSALDNFLENDGELADAL